MLFLVALCSVVGSNVRHRQRKFSQYSGIRTAHQAPAQERSHQAPAQACTAASNISTLLSTPSIKCRPCCRQGCPAGISREAKLLKGQPVFAGSQSLEPHCLTKRLTIPYRCRRYPVLSSEDLILVEIGDSAARPSAGSVQSSTCLRFHEIWGSRARARRVGRGGVRPIIGIDEHDETLINILRSTNR